MITKEDWLAFLHQLHNKVRNSKGIKLTGMSALNEINNFIMIRFIEKFIDKQKLPEICKFSYLYETFASEKRIKEDNKVIKIEEKNSYKLWKTIYDVKSDKECVIKVQCLKQFKKYLK
jgi:hypothetical protein